MEEAFAAFESEWNVMRYKNLHTASFDSIAPGAEGDLDPNNPSVLVAVEAGLLVPADGSPVPRTTSQDHKRIAELEAKNAALQARLATLKGAA